MMGKIKGFFAAGVLLVLLMAIMPVQVADAAEGDVYTVTYNLTGVDASPQETEVIEGSGLDLVFTPDSGYKLPDEISVQMAGEDMSGYIYESGNLIINEVYGNLVITVNAVPDDDEDSDFSDSDSDVYSISYDLYEVTASKQDGNVRAGTNYSVKLKANSGFRLDPLNVAVRVNGDYVASGYSYNEGLLEIDNVNGDIVIEAIAVQKASAKKNSNNTNNSDNSSKNNNKNNKTTDNNNTTGTSSTGSSSKSTQAISGSGQSARNYSTSSYRAPKTGDVNPDIRYYGALAFIFIGVGFVIVGKKYKKDAE